MWVWKNDWYPSWCIERQITTTCFPIRCLDNLMETLLIIDISMELSIKMQCQLDGFTEIQSKWHLVMQTWNSVWLLGRFGFAVNSSRSDGKLRLAINHRCVFCSDGRPCILATWPCIRFRSQTLHAKMALVSKSLTFELACLKTMHVPNSRWPEIGHHVHCMKLKLNSFMCTKRLSCWNAWVQQIGLTHDDFIHPCDFWKKGNRHSNT
jgi:hypothetical protein